MESTARLISDPTASEKQEDQTRVVARHDLASRFSSEQQAVPPARREAMGRALLEGVVFERQRDQGESNKTEPTRHRPPLAPVVEHPRFEVPRAPAQVSEQAVVEEAARQPISRFEHPSRTESFKPVPTQGREYRPPAPDRSPAEEPAVENPQLRPGERLVRSEWHNIIVGADGRPVERNQYGQGFLQEQHVEQLPDATADAQQLSGGKTSASDDHAMMGGNPLYQNLTSLPQAPTQQSMATLPSGMTSPTLPPGRPIREDSQHLLAPPKPKAGYKNPLVWVFFFVLLAAFFAASLAG